MKFSNPDRVSQIPHKQEGHQIHIRAADSFGKTGLGAVANLTLSRVRVDPGGRFLQRADGRPFFWLGDTAWSLLHRATCHEASHYLKTRAEQGFNLIQTVLLSELDGVRSPSAWGEIPFDNLDPLRPREAYFRRVDAFMEETASLGLYVGLLPTWGDKLTAPWGSGPRIFTTDNLPVAKQFGRMLGERYGGHTHLIWILGGDRPARLGCHPSNSYSDRPVPGGFDPDYDWTPVWRAMAEGVREVVGHRALMTYHPQGGPARTSVYLHAENWLDINSMQSGHGGGHNVPVWDWITEDMALSPPKPTFDSEPNYEGHPYNAWPRWNPATGYFGDHDVRKQCYRSVFAGACGVTYGHHALWQWACQRYEGINYVPCDWLQALYWPGGRQMIHLRRLMESRTFFDRIPDQNLIVDPPLDGPRHPRATSDETGSWAFVYFPEPDQVLDVRMDVFGANQMQSWWYDPRTGFAHQGDVFVNTPVKVRRFCSPPYGPDWVLVLDRSDAGYPPPGVV